MLEYDENQWAVDNYDKKLKDLYLSQNALIISFYPV